MKNTPKRSTTIKYINPEVPNVNVPEYKGKRQVIEIPDTLDPQEMAELAVNGLTGPTDPEADYEIYWRAAFNTNPPVIWHSESDCVQAKFMEALPLMRIASGSRQNMEVEQRWMEVMLQMQGPDGLLYLPKRGRPWCAFGNYGIEPPGDHYFSPWFEGRLLGAMTIYHILTGDKKWKEAGRKVVEGLARLMVVKGKKAHFPNHEFGIEGRYVPPKNPADAVHNPATFHSWAIQGLANYARHTGCEQALDISGKMARWVMEDSHHFAPDGRFLEEYPGVGRIHFHGHTMVLLSLLDYGLAAGDREAINFAHRGFTYGMSQGECRLGYFAEWLNLPQPMTLEVCELADMLAIALKLSAAGVGDYWDMADRWARNLFHEGQLHSRHAQRLHWLSDRTATTEIAPMTLPPYHTAERAIERNIGAFGGWLSPNDWMPDFPHDCGWRAPGIMHCCTGNAVRAIYYLWENCISFHKEELRVNLLMNRNSQWAEVQSHIPYLGRVDVRVKKPLNLSVRIPEWTKAEQITCTVDGKVRALTFNGRYAQVGKINKDGKVIVSFPMDQHGEWIWVEKRNYRILLRGNTCVAIDPPGRNVPLFHRDHYLEPATRLRVRERYVPDTAINW